MNSPSAISRSSSETASRAVRVDLRQPLELDLRPWRSASFAPCLRIGAVEVAAPRPRGRWRDLLEGRRFLAAVLIGPAVLFIARARRRAAAARDLPQPDRRDRRLADRRVRRPAQLHRGLGEPELPPRAAQHGHLHGRLAGDRAARRRGARARSSPSRSAGRWFLRFLVLLPVGGADRARDDRLPLDLRLALQRRELDARQRRVPGLARVQALQRRQLAVRPARRCPTGSRSRRSTPSRRRSGSASRRSRWRRSSSCTPGGSSPSRR